MIVPSEFDEIRPYNEEEVSTQLKELIYDPQFSRLLDGLVPWLPTCVRNALLRLSFMGIHTTVAFQRRFMVPFVHYLTRHGSKGVTFDFRNIVRGRERYTFVSNHRDIVMDSAILDILLLDHRFATSCEIGIGDNLFVYPWIRRFVRLNKSFTVRRGLGPRELQKSSHLMSRYMHFAVNGKRENIWIAQREGRSKDSSDCTQVAVLKMLAMGYEGTAPEGLMDMHIVPLAISYEYDPTDYLKAQEFQQKRDNPDFHKSKQDDLDNMRIGMYGWHGRIHYEAAPCIDSWISSLPQMPRNDFFAEVARHINEEIYRRYRLYPCNFIALDELRDSHTFANRYTANEKKEFDAYLDRQLAKVTIANPDMEFLRERMLTMYANPAINQLKLKER